MEKNDLIETVTLKRVILLEASCKRRKPEPVTDTKIEVRLSYDINFSEQSEKEFSLNLNSKLVATDSRGNGFFSIDAIFQGDFVIIQYKHPLDAYKDISDLLGSQIYPYIRSYLVDILVKMGLPLNLPWAINSEKNIQNKKPHPAKKIRKRKTE